MPTIIRPEVSHRNQYYISRHRYYELKKEVVPGSYRLFQVADFVSTVKLMEIKMINNELSHSEQKFVDSKHLKKNYIKVINKKKILLFQILNG